MCLFQFWFHQCVCPVVGLLGHKAVLFTNFKEFSTLFSIVAVLVCIPTNSVGGFPFLHTLSSIYCLQTMGREVGGGFMFGNACTPVVDSCQCMAKPIQYCKVK